MEVNERKEITGDLSRLFQKNVDEISQSYLDGLTLKVDIEGILISFPGTNYSSLYELNKNGGMYITSSGQAYPSLAKKVYEIVKPNLPKWSNEIPFGGMDPTLLKSCEEQIREYLKSAISQP